MKMLLKIAFRNLLRNLRRSTMTGSAVAAGAAGDAAVRRVRVLHLRGPGGRNNVQRIGHLTVFRDGLFFWWGAGNPAAYGIDHYQDVMKLIERDCRDRAR